MLVARSNRATKLVVNTLKQYQNSMLDDHSDQNESEDLRCLVVQDIMEAFQGPTTILY